MLQVTRSLDKITTEYTVFEQDQVLTHAQLNGLQEYLDDQGRLTRVGMIGIGIGCGLRVSLVENRVMVARGVGATSDGDLIVLTEGARYDRYKKYGDDRPEYAPLKPGGVRIPAFELVAEGVDDANASSLGGFANAEGKALGAMTAVLLVESYRTDDDLCESGDCDNLGLRAVNSPKLLLVDRGGTRSLVEQFPTPKRAFARLNEVVADRPVIPQGIKDSAALLAVYRASCNTTHGRLAAELLRLFGACKDILGDTFQADPTPTWKQTLDELNTRFQNGAAGVQYFYDFLVDLTETYNTFRYLLFDDATVCAPSVDAFPKHLVLGNLTPGADDVRTGFYPSPMVSGSSGSWSRARALALRIDAMITSFRIPDGEVRITPSKGGESELDARAIPFYYVPDGKRPIYQAWSDDLTRRSMATTNYGYHAATAGATGAAAKPLSAPLNRHSFFRIEGHQGKPVNDVVAILKRLIRANNLSIGIRAVLVHSDRDKIVVRFPPKFTDINRLQTLLKQAVKNQLDDLDSFGKAFSSSVTEAIATKKIEDDPRVNVVQPVQALVAQQTKAVADKTAAARTNIETGKAWTADARDAISAASQLRYQMGAFAKSDFAAPVESIIASPTLPLLDLLDDVVKVRDDNDVDALLFSAFSDANPGLEHAAGVPKGGTFVLAYDDAQRVVADFMLPYFLPDPVENKEPEPKFERPKVIPDWFPPASVRIVPPLDRVVATRLDDVDSRYTLLKQAVDIGKLSVRDSTIVGGVRPTATDPLLNERLIDLEAKTNAVDALRNAAQDPSLPEEKRGAVVKRLAEAEQELARSATETSTLLATQKVDLSKGTEGGTAVNIVANSMNKLTDAKAIEVANKGLAQAAKNSTTETNKLVFNRLIRGG
jgi:hypothetical protein